MRCARPDQNDQTRDRKCEKGWHGRQLHNLVHEGNQLFGKNDSQTKMCQKGVNWFRRQI